MTSLSALSATTRLSAASTSTSTPSSSRRDRVAPLAGRRVRGTSRSPRARARAAAETAAGGEGGGGGSTPTPTPTPTPTSFASDRTRDILTRLEASSSSSSASALGAGGRTTLAALEGLDAAWARTRAGQFPPRPSTPYVRVHHGETTTGFDDAAAADDADAFDVVVCGGTLGILVATALQRRGVKVAVVERGPLRGRAQEWNV